MGENPLYRKEPKNYIQKSHPSDLKLKEGSGSIIKALTATS